MIIKYEKIISELEVSRPSAPLRWIIKTVPAWQPLCPHAGPVLSQNIWVTAGGRRESDWDIWKKREVGTFHPPLFSTTTFLFVGAELDNSKLDLILWISGWADELLQHWMLCFSFRHISKVGGNTSPDLLTHWKSVTQYLIFDIYYCL